MNRFWALPISLIAGLGMAAASADAQSRPTGTIDGIVTDTNVVSLGNATISMLGSALRVATGDNGRFRIVDVQPGNYVLSVRHIGYASLAVALSIAAGDTARPSLTMRPIVAALDTMISSAKTLPARMSEFDYRRKLGFGHFISGEEIEKRNEVFLADLIRTVLSVTIAEKGFRQVAVNTRAGCAFQIYLDGLAIPLTPDLRDLPSPRELAGIEIYSGPATIPVQYRYGNASCGVILIWTKSG